MLPSLLSSRHLPTLTVFVGSFLLFLLQPLTGRTLLPIFGGSASVWMICLAVYQTLLLVGYGYAHLIARASVRSRSWHIVFLVASMVLTLLVVAVRPFLKNIFGAGDDPTLEVLLCVVLLVGLPYILLSANASLVQSWVSRRADLGLGTRDMGSGEPPTSHVTPPTSDVYRLYAVSNLGSFCGLLIFPFVLEPFVPLLFQWLGFALCLAGYAALLAKLARKTALLPYCHIALLKEPQQSGTEGTDGTGVNGEERLTPNAQRPTSNEEIIRDNNAIRYSGNKAMLLWLALPGTSAFLLNAVTAYLSIDVTPMPFVWVALLSAFLLSYVVGFSSWAHRLRWLLGAGALLALVGAAYARGLWGTGSFVPNASACLALLLMIGSILHAWLYELRPGPEQLTRYYLYISAGGAAGGLASSLLAPLLFNQVWEYPLILTLCAGLVAWRYAPRYRIPLACCCMVGWIFLAHVTQRKSDARVLYRSRNFYGCLAVTRTAYLEGPRSTPLHYLWCGQTTHGMQLMAPDRQLLPTSYFGATGGGIAFGAHPRYQQGLPMKVGVVGLGAGTLAAYGRKGDLFRFYEINEQVVDVATNASLFTYLPLTRASVDLVMGDARRMLERERANHLANPKRDPLYDLLIIDAYNGDAVPYHLTTREAFQLYFDRIAPDGMLAVHISNWHIDLLPLCKAVAEDLGVCAYGSIGYSDSAVTIGAIWVFMTRQPLSYRYPGRPERIKDVDWSTVRTIRTLTDDCGSLMPLLR